MRLHSATRSFALLLNLVHICVWNGLMLLLFLARVFARVDTRSVLSMSSITELVYFENALAEKSPWLSRPE